jgi:glyoxylase I family protein
MLVTPIHHAAIVVSNLEKSIHFYRDILGLKILFDDTLSIPNMPELLGLREGVEGRTVILQKDEGIVNGMVELMEIKNPKNERPKKGVGFHSKGLRMLSFRVDDIDKMYNALVGKGVKFISPPKQLNWKTWSIRVCIFTDPDDVLIEIMEFLPLSHK